MRNNASALMLSRFGVSFGAKAILANVNLNLPARGTDVLMGPAGCGKSTLLNALAGNLDTNSQYRSVGDAFCFGSPIAACRPILVRQHLRILHASVCEALASQLRPVTVKSVAAWVDFAIESLAEWNLQHVLPSLHSPLHLCRPEEVRAVTILAHALMKPSLLCIDEPTYGLDDTAADWVISWLQSVSEKARLLVVLHHQTRARRLANRITLLGGGRVLAHQQVEDFFVSPANAEVEQFVCSGSVAVASPDSRPEDLDPGFVLSRRSGQSNRNGECHRSALGVAHPESAAVATRKPAVLPPVSKYGVALAASIGVTRPRHSDAIWPPGFHWVVANRFAGCVEPGVVNPIRYDLGLLRSLGVSRLVSLSESSPDEGLLRCYGILGMHVPIAADCTAPTVRQTYMLLRRIQLMLESGEVVAVYCRAGVGQTGTVLAAWLVREGGLSADHAIEQIRRIEPSYVNSVQQEEFLRLFESDLLMRT